MKMNRFPGLEKDPDVWLLRGVDRRAPLRYFTKTMNVSVVNSVPNGEFVEVSVLMNGWQNRFQFLVGQHRPIKFDFYPMPDLPSEIHESLAERGYRDVVFKKDQWQHFFIPEQNRNS